ncbi:PAAR domain-containing protein [Enterobacter mori]|uniref:PAAR domain-containing protein n=1 Tax=Enterobacter mori TaxID=539813 RepID=UPI003891BA83
MGKNAARQIADKAGHDGPITTGSTNVTTGGFPAARMGDSFTCKEHGPGVISEGSKTVTINGMPAARYGDKVICGKETLPPTKAPKPPEYHYATLAKNTNEDGSVKVKNPEEFQMNVLLASSQLSDSDGDGNFDTANSKAVITDFQLSHQMGDSGVNFNLGGTVGKIEMTAETTSGEKGSSAAFDVNVTGVSGNVGISTGTEGSGNYGEVKAEGTVGSAEAKAESRIIDDEAEHQYGFKTELGAEAAIAKGDITFASETQYLRVKGGISGSAGSVGLSGGAGVMIDTDDIMLKVNLSGEVAAFLGLGGDMGIQLGPFIHPPVGGTGTILSGLGTVIIGG